MKTLIAAFVALSAVATAASAAPYPHPFFEGPQFGPSDLRTFDGPAFGPKDIRGFDGPQFGPSDIRSFDGPAQTWSEGGNQR